MSESNTPPCKNPTFKEFMIENLIRDAERMVEVFRKNLPSILARERARKLERENEQLRKMNEKMSDTNTDTRRRIEDMTLGEIKALKTRLEDRIGEAICVAIGDFQRAYDLGDVDLRVDTDIREFKTAQGEKFAPSMIRYDINVKFKDVEI